MLLTLVYIENGQLDKAKEYLIDDPNYNIHTNNEIIIYVFRILHFAIETKNFLFFDIKNKNIYLYKQ